MLVVLNFVYTIVFIVVKNLVLFPQGAYSGSELSLCKVGRTLPPEPLIEQGSPSGYPRFADCKLKNGHLYYGILSL
jgi:hypothetical protein